MNQMISIPYRIEIQSFSQIALFNLTNTLCPASPTWISGRAGWAELVCQIEQGYLAATLDFYSVWYRDHLVMKIAKSEQLHFGMTGPNKRSILDFFFSNSLVIIITHWANSGSNFYIITP